MKTKLLILAVYLTCIVNPLFASTEGLSTSKSQFGLEITPFLNSINQSLHTISNYYELSYTKNLLESANLDKTLTETILNTLTCANLYGIEFNPVLTIIDYSLPSSKKRLWVFDLQNKKLLFHTYVSHGIKSGKLSSNFFSNRYNSRASSLGVYLTEKTYYGREGLSLKLAGLDAEFNDRALDRAIVMHGGWYMDENFIKKYGRAGRSWGCPALPLTLSSSIINTIKNNSLFMVYFPSEQWLSKSKFLNCSAWRHAKSQPLTEKNPTLSLAPESESREELFYADTKKENKYLESKPILVMSAQDYQTIYQSNLVPLHRMLRRQINNTEYIALSKKELQQLINSSDSSLNNSNSLLDTLSFVIPVIKMRRGYYHTEMHFVTFGKIEVIKEVSSLPTSASKLNSAANSISSTLSLKETTNYPSNSSKINSTTNYLDRYVIYFKESPPIYLNATQQFIRWIGL